MKGKLIQRSVVSTQNSIKRLLFRSMQFLTQFSNFVCTTYKILYLAFSSTDDDNVFSLYSPDV